MSSQSQTSTRDFTIRIRSEELFKQLKVFAAEKGIPLYEAVEHLINIGLTTYAQEPINGDTD